MDDNGITGSVSSGVVRPGLQDLCRSPANFLALGFGSGLAPTAPGTFGTLAAVPLWFLMPGALVPYLLITGVLFVVGIWCCGACARALGVHDHGAIVWDEIVGYFITMLAVPHDLLWAVVGFALFRLFDVWKPWPIRVIDRKVDGGLGIMLDDVLAAAFAGIVMQCLLGLTR